MALITERVELARQGANDKVICRMASGWAVMGDAVLQATGALRMNYEILGNSEPELHCHLFPRYASEPDDKRTMPAWFYDWKNAVPYTEHEHGTLCRAIAELLENPSTY